MCAFKCELLPYALPHPSQGQMCVRFFGFEELPEEPLALVVGGMDFFGVTISATGAVCCWEMGRADGSTFTIPLLSFGLVIGVVVAAFNSDSMFINARWGLTLAGDFPPLSCWSSRTGFVATGVEETDEGGVGSEGVMNRSGFTAKHARSIVSWLRFANTLATRNRAVEPLSAAAAAAAASPIFCASPVTLIVGRVSAVKKVVWLDLGEKGGVGPLWIMASSSVAILFDAVTNSEILLDKSQQNFELETQTTQMDRALA